MDDKEDKLEEFMESEGMKEKLEEIIDRRVEERLKERKGKNERDSQERMSRRSFLRKLGAGVISLGALGLLPASATNIKSSDGLEVWDSGTEYFEVKEGAVNLQNSASLDMGSSKITSLADPSNSQDAATKSWVENNASSTARDVARNAQGEVKFTQAGKKTVTATQIGTSVTAQTGTTGRIIHDRIQADMSAGQGIIKLLRGGNTIKSGNAPISTSGTPKSSSLNWTMEVSPTSLPSQNFTKSTYYGNASRTLGFDNQKASTTRNFTGKATNISMYGKFYVGGTDSYPQTFRLKLNGSTLTESTKIATAQTFNKPYQLTTTISSDNYSPSLTWEHSINYVRDRGSIFIASYTAKGVTYQTAKATLTASKNRTVKLE